MAGLRKRLPWLKRFLLWPLEGLAAYSLFFFAKSLPVDVASALGGWIARNLGPWIPPSAKTRDNLRLAFPDMSAVEIDQILRGVWDNVGRTAMEFPHLPAFRVHQDSDRFQVVGTDIIRDLIDDDQPAVFVGGHLANWELPPPMVTQLGLSVRVFFRPPNNPWVRGLFENRLHEADSSLLAKGSQGGREALSYLRRGGHLGIMVDQKLSNGIAVPFFGRPAMTGPIAARFALRFRCPLVPIQVVRLDGCRFRIIAHPPMDLPDSGDMDADVLALTGQITAMIEDWIRQHPEQWFWLHDRWKGAPATLEDRSSDV